MKLKLSFGFVLITILFGISIIFKSATAQSAVTLLPIEDSYVRMDSATGNYGSRTPLIASSYSSSSTQIAYMKFDLTTLSGKTLQTVNLIVTAALDRTVEKEVRLIPGTTWSENTITWNNKPTSGIVIGRIPQQSVAPGTKVNVSLDAALLTNYVGKVITLSVDNTTQQSTFSFNSKEAASDKPTLSLQTGTSSFIPDANRDGKINGIDYVIWLIHYNLATTLGVLDGDFDGNKLVNDADYPIWLQNYGKTFPTTTTTPSYTNTPTPGTTTNTPTTQATKTPTPTVTGPTPVPGSGIWISKDEIKRLPITGQAGCLNGSLCANAWNALVTRANSSWGTPNLSAYSGHDPSVSVYAGALVAVRCESTTCANVNASAIRTKVLGALDAAVGTEQIAATSGTSGELLSTPRQFPRYVIAAELMGVTNWEAGYRGYKNFVDYMAHTRFVQAASKVTFAEQHDEAASNGNTMAGFARIVSDLYLGDKADLDKAWLTFRRYAGDTTVGPNLYINDAGRTWFYANYNTAQHMGINPKGSTCNGNNYPADGAIPADQGRGSNCPTDPNAAPGYTQYPWEGLQGIFGQAEIFKRHGYKDSQGNDPYHIQNSALLRAVQYQWYLQNKFGGSWYDSSRASWVKHLVYLNYGYKPMSYSASDEGRNISFTQWTHQ